MTLNVLAWNSQGDRADTMWRRLTEMGDPANPGRVPGQNLLPGRFPGGSGATDDLLVFVCEASTPPWISPAADVTRTRGYRFRDGYQVRSATWFNHANTAGITGGVAGWGSRPRPGDAFWVPWQLSTDPRPSLRCSLALYWFPGARSTRTCQFGEYRISDGDPGRPVLTATITRGGVPQAVLVFAHLPAIQALAKRVLPDVVSLADGTYGRNFPLMIMGDLNINASGRGAFDTVPAGWTPRTSGRSTHQGNAQLDWGLSNSLLSAPAPTLVWSFNDDGSVAPAERGPSDHAMLRYALASA